MASLGLVHVVGGHEDRDTVGREIIDEVPETASRFGVDTTGGLVEEDHRRLVEESAGEGEPLTEASREIGHKGVAP